MTVAAPRTLSTEIEAAFAVTPNTPVPKSSSSLPPPATQAALFPDLLGQMVDSETEEQPFSRPGAAAGSKATTAPPARASGKPAAEKNRTASAATTSATASELGQNPVTSDPASARTHYPWPPQDSALSLMAVLSGSVSETSNAGGDAAATKASATQVGEDGEAASGQVQATRAAGKLGQAVADGNPPPAGGEQASNPVTEATGGSLIEAAALTLRAGSNAAAARQPSELPSPIDGAGARAAGRGPAAALSSSQVPASSPSGTAAVPRDDRVLASGWQPAAPAREMAETRPGETRAAEPPEAAQVASTADAVGVDAAASLFARLAAPSGDRTFEPDGGASDRSGANAADGAGSPDGASFAEQGTLAFQAWLVPAPASDPQCAGQGLREAGDAAGDQQPALAVSAGSGGGRSGFRSTRDADPGLASSVPPGLTGGASQAGQAAHGFPMVAPVSSNPGTAAPPQGANHQPAVPPGTAILSAWDAAAPAPKPSAGGPAREIQFELRDADARVNVRLVERAGSVQVDVRTPDSHLASSLRDDLPALTARLEQTGLRAETWHDAPAAAAARLRMAEPASSAGFPSSQNQSRREGGGRDSGDGQPQEKRQNQNQPEPKEFSWLYTSLQ
jgi:hypothetical protein